MLSRKEQEILSRRDCIRKIYFQLSSDEELHTMFNKFDANSDRKKKSPWKLGYIKRSPGYDVMEDQVWMMMAEANSDGDAYMGLSELCSIHMASTTLYVVGSGRCLQDVPH